MAEQGGGMGLLFPAKATSSWSSIVTTCMGKDMGGCYARQIFQNLHGWTDEGGMVAPLGTVVASTDGRTSKDDADLSPEDGYLIVIDDVWTIAAWDAIRSTLPDNNLDSRIMVTTRIDAVAVACSDASEICGDNIYHIEPLNPEDSKKLFLSRAFGSKDATCPTELEGEMNKILKKCGGLPLAIVSIGSLLASYKSPEHKDMWDRVCKSISYHMDTNPTLDGMRQILTLSYDHLPYHLKGCMMYLSIFPEDFLINKDRLVYRWIAEGLIEEKRGMTLLEVAEAYYDDSSLWGMINPAGEIISHVYGAVDTCRVHDLMLEVMVSKSLEANFVSLIGGQYDGMSYDTIRRLSVHGGAQMPKESPSKKDSPSKRPKESTSKKMVKKNDLKDINVQHVRSLSMFQLEGNKQLLDRLGEFTLLRVLDLEDCKGVENKHMGHICRMYLLWYLSLRGTDISVLPPKVCDLEHLLTLDVRATGLARLPETLIKLEKLERLFFSQKDVWSTMWKPPQGLWKMKALREVGWVLLEDDAVEVAQEVGELENLQRLSIYVDCEKPNGPKVLEELALSLSRTHSLRSLDMGTMSYEANALNFLLELPSPPRLLRFLRIAGGIDKLPNWVESLTYLVEFHMSWAHFIDDQLFGVLCKLPNLKSIWMQRNCYTGLELVACAAHNFPALKNLRGTCDQEMPRVYKFEEGSMTKLEKLSLNFDNWSEKSIVGIEHLTSLKEVQLAGKRGNPALDRTLELLKAESGRHPNHFTVGVKYD
ncbi:disease resistance protein Pik-2-like [Triticum dicoccoides]|uniref:disease resistance protein Pik-2-like n=1 Tax=Triticum dicoccoides TaxID=85692 RepID=UPI00188DFA9C|nr:disease resistance protein Pik-2-like [Triticum dicoccoides]